MVRNDLFVLENALKNIKNMREEQEITQRLMAERMGISESFYCQLEGGKRKITVDYAIKIANILSKTLDEIFLNYNFLECEGTETIE